MKISNGVWIALSVSVFVGIVIMIVTLFVVRIKIKKIKREALLNISTVDLKENAALKRKDSGELLWELKNKSKNPLEDVQLEFLINTSFRNNYKTIKVLNSSSKYEEDSFKKIVKIKSGTIHNDLVIIFNDSNINSIFDVEYKKMKQKKMIAIVNSPRKNKQTKSMINYLKLIKANYDYATIGKGIILIVK